MRTPKLDSFLWAPILAIRDLGRLFTRILGWRYVAAQTVTQAGFGLASNYFVNVYVMPMLYAQIAEINSSYESLSGPNMTCAADPFAPAQDAPWMQFHAHVMAALPFLAYYMLSRLMMSGVNQLLSIHLRRTLIDALQEKYFSGQTALAMSHSQEQQNIAATLNASITTVSDNGSLLFTSALEAMLAGGLSLKELNRFSSSLRLGPVTVPDLLFYSAAYAAVTQLVTFSITAQQKKLQDRLRAQGTIIGAVTHHDVANIKTLTLSGADAVHYANAHLKTLIAPARRTENVIYGWDLLLAEWTVCHNYMNMLFKFYLIGHKLFDGTIQFQDRSIVDLSNARVEQLFSWTEKYAPMLTAMQTPMLNVIRFLDEHDARFSKMPSVLYGPSSTQDLVIRDLRIHIGERPLLTIPAESPLTFAQGTRTLITGASGNGKSSFLAKLNGITEDGIDATGRIDLPTRADGQPCKIRMLSQMDYFPLESSLLQIIYFPRELPTEPDALNALKERVSTLLTESKIDASSANGTHTLTNRLDETPPNWGTILSGGQKKKLAIISAILTNDLDMLFLDEIFNGLDTGSITIMQSMLRTYLPNTTMLIVDHHGVTNDRNPEHPFFHRHIEFENQGVIDRGEIKQKEARTPSPSPGGTFLTVHKSEECTLSAE